MKQILGHGKQFTLFISQNAVGPAIMYYFTSFIYLQAYINLINELYSIQTVGGSLVSTSLGFPLTPGKTDLSTALMAFGCSVTFMSSGK